jgi:hypothetical protein
MTLSYKCSKSFHIIDSRVTAHYVIVQSMISIFDMNKILGDEVKHTYRDST